VSDHAGPATAHALIRAIAIAKVIEQGQAPHAARLDAADLRRLLEDALEDVAALQQAIERYQIDLRTVRDESIEAEREITALRETRDRVTQLLEKLYPVEADQLTANTERFNTVVEIRQLLHEDARRPFEIPIHQAPRVAAGA
jgi:hypothetical protein